MSLDARPRSLDDDELPPSTSPSGRGTVLERVEWFRTIVVNAPDYLTLHDLSGRLLYANPAVEHFLSQPAAERQGLRPTDPAPDSSPMLTPEFTTTFQSKVLEVVRTGQPSEGEGSWPGTEGGAPIHHHIRFIPVFGADGRVECVAAYGRDVSTLVRSEEKLRKLSRAVEQSPASIIITDLKGTIEYVNPKFCAVTGYSVAEALGHNPSILKSGETPLAVYVSLWQTILGGREWRGELHNRKKSGELYWESVSISPVFGPGGGITHFVAVKEDITERRRLEEDLRQAQKMEAFGQLAGGVAHDFNNLLTVIRGNAAQLQDDALTAAEREGCLDQVLEAAERAERLTRQMLVFSRRQPAQLRDLDLNVVVTDMARMLRRLIGEHIRLSTECAPGGAPVRADLGMMEQLLMNLAVNSRDAMPRGGELVIRTEVVEATGEGPQRGMPPGRYVRLLVSDSGQGIEPENLPHVFEPFYTTKEAGRGTGLGLATVFGIVAQHGGRVDVTSTVGAGTTFYVVLPALATVPRAEGARPSPAKSGGTETLLLVEDDPSVRSVAMRILQRHGYRVLEANTGKAALEVWAGHRDEIALVLTDVVMPGGMSGRDLAERLRADKPDLKVIYSTGYTNLDLAGGAAPRGAPSVLEKPYEPADLLRRVRACLDEGGAA